MSLPTPALKMEIDGIDGILYVTERDERKTWELSFA